MTETRKEQFIIQGKPRHGRHWEYIGYSTEDGRILNPCNSRAEAEQTLADINKALREIHNHNWHSLRIIHEVSVREDHGCSWKETKHSEVIIEEAAGT